jgi:mycothiol system anti-sigma-R factor
MMTCTTCVRALQPYIDRELSDEDIVQVHIHLDECVGCLHLFHFEESVRRLVRVRCQEQRAPAEFRARISASLEAERVRLQRRARVARTRSADEV